MKTIKIPGMLLVAALSLSACVSPEVVTKTSVDDKNLTCEQIATQMQQLEEIRTEAEKGKTASGKNVAAAILFWPAIIGNYQNAKQALEAANERHEVLVKLAEQKRCKL